MWQLVFIAIGGALGAASRYGVSVGMHGVLGVRFPYGTLTVNVVGSFLIGLLSALFFDRVLNSISLRSLFLIGFLGAFTTFSSFALETLNSFEAGQMLIASLNVVLNVLLCLMAVWLGTNIGRAI